MYGHYSNLGYAYLYHISTIKSPQRQLSGNTFGEWNNQSSIPGGVQEVIRDYAPARIQL